MNVMLIFYSFLSAFILFFIQFSFEAHASFLLFNSQDLIQLQRCVGNKDPLFQSTVESLIEEANEELFQGPYSVINKTKAPPNGDMHDYMTLARYYWPNPKGKKGLPYINKDCKTNPEIFSDRYNYTEKAKMVRSSIQLCLAYHLTKEEKYAAHAALIIDTWFLNPESCMNPNLNYAQIIPGRNNNNPYGVIDGHVFPFIFEVLNFLDHSPSWSIDQSLKMKEWAKKYLKWLLESFKGITLRRASNNQASWYDMQVIYFALYTDQKEIAAEFIDHSTSNKLTSHFVSDFSQPQEMKRRKNIYYSIFNLQALFYCALLGTHIQRDLWQNEENKKGALFQGLDFLTSYLEKNKIWDKDRIELIDFTEMTSLLLIAATVSPDSNYFELYQKVDEMTSELSDQSKQIPHRLVRLFYPQPFLRKQ